VETTEVEVVFMKEEVEETIMVEEEVGTMIDMKVELSKETTRIRLDIQETIKMREKKRSQKKI
jgi:hypothetical protein